MPRFSKTSIRAFTLIELSIVVLVLSLLAGAAMRYANSIRDTNSLALTNKSMDFVQAAILNYRLTYGRLPCPADLTQAENTAAFGLEVSTAGDGNCTGYNFINSAADPDVADPNYDATTSSKVVAGGIPVKTLRLADRYAYDAWGNKIFFIVDKRMTAANAFSIYSANNSTIGAIVIKRAYGDTLANAFTYKAVYALVSTGQNSHGSYARNLTSTSVRAGSGSTNTDELSNCHCDSLAASTPFNRIFVQKPKTIDYTSTTNNFDDIVRYMNRNSLTSITELQ